MHARVEKLSPLTVSDICPINLAKKFDELTPILDSWNESRTALIMTVIIVNYSGRLIFFNHLVNQGRHCQLAEAAALYFKRCLS